MEAGAGEDSLSVSVVIAATSGLRTLPACLSALADRWDDRLDVLVVSADEPPHALRSRFEGVRWIAAQGSLVPELWADGIAAATGQIVALTTADHRPAPGWVQKIRAAHASTAAVAIGGRIVPPAKAKLLCWAAWFLRYSELARWQEPREIPDPAADNASYQRAVLRRYAALYRDGFWEPAVHKAMRSDGERLRFDPEIVVTLQGTPGLAAFLVQRLRHGIEFGSWRAMEFSSFRRIAAILLSPLIPVVFFAKIVARVVRLQRHGLQFLLATPLLMALILAWSAGEAIGYVSAPWRWAAHAAARFGYWRPAATRSEG